MSGNLTREKESREGKREGGRDDHIRYLILGSRVVTGAITPPERDVEILVTGKLTG